MSHYSKKASVCCNFWKQLKSENWVLKNSLGAVMMQTVLKVGNSLLISLIVQFDTARSWLCYLLSTYKAFCFCCWLLAPSFCKVGTSDWKYFSHLRSSTGQERLSDPIFLGIERKAESLLSFDAAMTRSASEKAWNERKTYNSTLFLHSTVPRFVLGCHVLRDHPRNARPEK